MIVELGAGTGYYLAAVLRELAGSRTWSPRSTASRPALRRHALRADPRIAAVACEMHGARAAAARRLGGRRAGRVRPAQPRRRSRESSAPAAALVVVTPTPRHLQELVGSGRDVSRSTPTRNPGWPPRSRRISSFSWPGREVEFVMRARPRRTPAGPGRDGPDRPPPSARQRSTRVWREPPNGAPNHGIEVSVETRSGAPEAALSGRSARTAAPADRVTSRFPWP